MVREHDNWTFRRSRTFTSATAQAMRLQFRVEVFNIFNTPQFNIPVRRSESDGGDNYQRRPTAAVPANVTGNPTRAQAVLVFIESGAGEFVFRLGRSLYSRTGWCFATQSGSKSTPNPGPDGTLTFPFAILSVEVLHPYRMFAPTSLNS